MGVAETKCTCRTFLLKTGTRITTEKKQYKNSITIQGIEVSDQPRFEYRGFLLDVARNFQTKEKSQ